MPREEIRNHCIKKNDQEAEFSALLIGRKISLDVFSNSMQQSLPITLISINVYLSYYDGYMSMYLCNKSAAIATYCWKTKYFRTCMYPFIHSETTKLCLKFLSTCEVNFPQTVNIGRLC